MKHIDKKRAADDFSDLTDGVEDLLRRIADVDSPDVRKIRAKVQVALTAAKSAWQDTTSYANRTIHRPGEYLRESPWKTVGIATLLGIGVGALLLRPRADS
jgi:ElaB/YqjD/DUF883 family membrane-anchored ribosome-binding protein